MAAARMGGERALIAQLRRGTIAAEEALTLLGTLSISTAHERLARQLELLRSARADETPATADTLSPAVRAVVIETLMTQAPAVFSQAKVDPLLPDAPAKLRSFVKGLSDRNILILYLAFVRGFTVPEIATRLELSGAAVKGAIYNSIFRMLRKRLGATSPRAPRRRATAPTPSRAELLRRALWEILSPLRIKGTIRIEELIEAVSQRVAGGELSEEEVKSLLAQAAEWGWFGYHDELFPYNVELLPETLTPQTSGLEEIPSGMAEAILADNRDGIADAVDWILPAPPEVVPAQQRLKAILDATIWGARPLTVEQWQGVETFVVILNNYCQTLKLDQEPAWRAFLAFVGEHLNLLAVALEPETAFSLASKAVDEAVLAGDTHVALDEFQRARIAYAEAIEVLGKTIEEFDTLGGLPAVPEDRRQVFHRLRTQAQSRLEEVTRRLPAESAELEELTVDDPVFAGVSWEQVAAMRGPLVVYAPDVTAASLKELHDRLWTAWTLPTVRITASAKDAKDALAGGTPVLSIVRAADEAVSRWAVVLQGLGPSERLPGSAVVPLILRGFSHPNETISLTDLSPYRRLQHLTIREMVEAVAQFV